MGEILSKKLTVLFDLDGTLIDSTEAILEGFHQSFKENSDVLPDEEKIHALIGYPLDVMFEGLGVPRGHIDAFVTSYKQHYRQIATQKTVLIESAKEAVFVAEEFAELGVVTTKTRHYSVEILEHLGIGHCFKTVVGRECVTHPKPHSEPIITALERMQRDRQNCYMVGDTMLDLLASEEANVGFVGVKSSYGDTKAFAQKCEILKTNPLEAVLYLRNLAP